MAKQAQAPALESRSVAESTSVVDETTTAVQADPAPVRLPKAGDQVLIWSLAWDGPNGACRAFSETGKVKKVYQPENPQSPLDIELSWDQVHEACDPLSIRTLNNIRHMHGKYCHLDEGGYVTEEIPDHPPVLNQEIALFGTLPAPPPAPGVFNQSGGPGWLIGKVVKIDPDEEWICDIAVPETETRVHVTYGNGENGPHGSWGWPT